MPTYEYACQKCGRHFDVFQRMTDDALKTCPATICDEKEWGQGEVKRLLSGGAGLIFKGSGFYITDYAKKNSSPATAPESSLATSDTKTKSTPDTSTSEPVKKESKAEQKNNSKS